MRHVATRGKRLAQERQKWRKKLAVFLGQTIDSFKYVKYIDSLIMFRGVYGQTND